MSALHLFFKVIMLHNYKMISGMFFMKRLFFEWKYRFSEYEKVENKKCRKTSILRFLYA